MENFENVENGAFGMFGNIFSVPIRGAKFWYVPGSKAFVNSFRGLFDDLEISAKKRAREIKKLISTKWSSRFTQRRR